jgi:hypothetical protein
MHLERTRANAKMRQLDPLTAEQKALAALMISKEDMQALRDIDKP